MDFALLAQALTIFIAPALPYLGGLAGRIAKKGAEELEASVWDQAKKIWGRLGPEVEAKPAALDPARDVAAEPDDEAARVALAYQLRKILAADPDLAAELAELLEKADPRNVYHASLQGSGAIAQGPGAVAAGERGVAVGGSVSGSVIVTGDRGRVER